MSTLLPIEKILPDKSQPREYFSSDKMFQVKESLRKEGMATPIDVMDNGDGTYLIIDGERRYRSAIELGWREVPVTINPKMSDQERFVRQFHIQEYHEPWTPIEKAQSIIKISETLGMNLTESCLFLGVSKRDTLRYVAFAELADKKAYLESEVPLAYAESIKSLKNVARKTTDEELNEDFTLSDEKKIEGAIIKMVKSGSIRKKSQVTKVADSIKKEPGLIKKLMDGEEDLTPEQLFREAKAKGAHALRNLTMNCRYVISHARVFLQERDVKISADQFDTFMTARDVLNKIIDIA